MTAMQALDQANPHVLQALLNASSTRPIFASQDIVDDRGMKLWARDQPISHSLQQRLLERKLKQPLESCLRVEGGVTADTLREGIENLLASDHPLVPSLQPYGKVLVEQARHLPLHSVAQLLLTTVQATRAHLFDHAVCGMALAGAMAASVSLPTYDMRLALLGGLLHDIGEIYVNPQYLDAGQPLDAQGYKHVVVHPRIGSMLLSQLTDYPAHLARAVAEHHERLDGSGYPARLAGEVSSPLGRMLAVVETTLGVMSAPNAPLTRASFALRLVPNEFDARWTRFVYMASRAAEEDCSALAATPTDVMTERMSQLSARLQSARAMALNMAKSLPHKEVQQALEHAVHVLDRLRMAFNSLGLWQESAYDDAQSVDSRYEIALAQRELSHRMRSLRREMQRLCDGLPNSALDPLEPLWPCLDETLAPLRAA